MGQITVSRDFEGGLFPEAVEVSENRIKLAHRPESPNHFYFHFRVENSAAGPCQAVFDCEWLFSPARYGLFPEVRRGEQWDPLAVSGFSVDETSEVARATFLLDLSPGETVYVANTPCMSYADVMATVDRCAREHASVCEKLSLGTNPQGNKVAGVRFRGDNLSRPRFVVLGTPQGPEYGGRMACALVEFLASDQDDARFLRGAFRLDVVPMPNPDDKRTGSSNFTTLFDMKAAADGSPEAAWHAKTLWSWLAQKPPELLMELHSETRLKQQGCSRVYVVAEDVHPSAAGGKLARRIADQVDGLPNGGWLDVMEKRGFFEPTLMYQAPHRWDTITISYTPHIRYGVEANRKSVASACLTMAKAYLGAT